MLLSSIGSGAGVGNNNNDTLVGGGSGRVINVNFGTGELSEVANDGTAFANEGASLSGGTENPEDGVRGRSGGGRRGGGRRVGAALGGGSGEVEGGVRRTLVGDGRRVHSPYRYRYSRKSQHSTLNTQHRDLQKHNMK